MENIKIKLDKKEKQVEKGKTLLQIIGERKPDDTTPALAAMVKNTVRELRYIPQDGDDIRLIDVSDKVGNQIYVRSVMHILVQAAKHEYPDSKVFIEHSMSEGIYCELHGNEELSPFMLERIEREMHRIAEKDEPYVRNLISRDDAIAFYRAQGNEEKARLLRFREDKVFKVYSCGGVSDYFYGHMPPSTGYTPKFALKVFGQGFVMLFPRAENPEGELVFNPRPKLSYVFRQSERWADILGCGTVPDLNEMVERGELGDFIRVNEGLHERSISDIASQIIKEKRRIVLVAGPSSSGKTTFTQRLSVQLRAAERETQMISLDNYYLELNQLKPEPDGSYDLESIHALDLPLINENLEALLNGKTVEIPKFDFKTKKRVKGRSLNLDGNKILLIEGIHGLNDMLTENVDADDKFKVYISALTQLNLDNQNRISTTGSRIIRRMVRDYQHRNTSAEQTFAMWKSVRAGEEKWIFPFQESCDVMFNSTLVYELLFLKRLAYPLLDSVKEDSENFTEANYLKKILKYFADVDPEAQVDVPRTSILREFIGGGCFDT